MKKIIALVLTVVMLCSMTAMMVNAADITPAKQSQAITISYGSTEGYEVTIPADVILGELDVPVVTAGVQVSKVSLDPTHRFKVTAESANNYKVALDGADHTVPYAMVYGTNNTEISTATGPVTLVDIASGTESASCNVSFKRLGNASVTGTYRDTIMFVASIYTP